MPTDKGVKLDENKTDMTFLRYFPHALEMVCLICTLGAKKYTRDGWRTVADGERRYGAAGMRHWLGLSKDEDNWAPNFDGDEELMHAAQHAWNALAELELMWERKTQEKLYRDYSEIELNFENGGDTSKSESKHRMHT